jgi:prepilin-type N-terminal cleavage/methylation domain-containing protein
MKSPRGFTLIELIVAIAIIAILAAVIAPNAFKTIEKAKITKALRVATMSYYADVGFWPPDVNRGVDPGFMQANRVGEPGATMFPFDPIAQGYMANWNTVLLECWDGPYLDKWPRFTPWAGKYDWNYWSVGTNRGTPAIWVPAGCYIGVQGDYNFQNPIPLASEIILVDKGFDFDGGVNGESQLLMTNLQ